MPSPPPPQRVRILAVILVGLALIATKRAERYYDFTTYYLTGLLVTEGAPERPFDAAAINKRFQEFLPSPGRRVGAFMYSPVYLLPAALASRLSYDSAVVVNQLLTLLAILGVLYLILERLREPWLAALVAVGFVACHPVSVQFIYQNWSVYVVALVATGWVLTRRGPEWAAALCWALALHLKLFVGLFFLPLALGGRLRLVVKSLAAALALGAAVLPWVGLESYLAFTRLLGRVAAAGVTTFYNKISLQATMGRFLTEPSDWLRPTAPVQHPAIVALFWVALPLFAALVYRHRRELERTLALTVPFVLLFFPQVWVHTELLIVLLLLSPALPRRGAWMLAAALVVSWGYGAAVGNLVGDVMSGGGGRGLGLALLFYPVLNLLMIAILLGEGDSPPPTPGEGAPSAPAEVAS